MEVQDLKKRLIEKSDIPHQIVFIDNCYTLTNEYLKAFSKSLNRRIIHCYSLEEAKRLNGRFDRRDLLGVLHGQIKDFKEVFGISDVYYIDIETEDVDTSIEKVIFPKLNKSQCIMYIENWLCENGFFNKDKDSLSTKVPTLSRENVERLIDYFDADLDQCMGELEKLKCLGIHALNQPFDALYDCLPSKQKKLKCLPWYSGGAVDTGAVLSATYLKKLKAAGDMKVPVKKQLWYSQLITEGLFIKLGVMSGYIADYTTEYFRLIEQMSPEEYKIQWFPPVTREEIGEEWSYRDDRH